MRKYLALATHAISLFPFVRLNRPVLSKCFLLCFVLGDHLALFLPVTVHNRITTLGFLNAHLFTFVPDVKLRPASQP